MGLIFPSRHLLKKAVPPDRFAAEILEIEKELDDLYPAWRQPSRSRLAPNNTGIMGTRGIEDMEVKARAKVLLQRRKYLYDGKDFHPVLVTVQGADGRIRMFAHSAESKVTHTREGLHAASQTRRQSVEQQASIEQIARAMKVTPRQVEALVLDAPPGANLYHWARAKINARPKPTPKPATKKKLAPKDAHEAPTDSQGNPDE